LLSSHSGVTFRFDPGALCLELLTTGGPGAFARYEVLHAPADDCSLVYVDTSRPGRRRWCSMEHCGNRHKVRTLRARRSEGASGEG
jgi:predicted RNA-binding Zn ribbon-like protein